jgi:hypothetical protein
LLGTKRQTHDALSIVKKIKRVKLKNARSTNTRRSINQEEQGIRKPKKPAFGNEKKLRSKNKELNELNKLT